MSAPNGRFDLDKKRREREAAAKESARERYVFIFGGREFSLAPAGQWPANAKKILDAGDFSGLLDVLLDDPTGFWEIKPTATVDDVTELFEAYGAWAGMGENLGESLASSQAVTTPT